MSTLLMGYDIETNNPEGTRAFCDAVLKLHRRVGFPFSLYCVGKTIELQPKYFEQLARDTFVDIESHTYSHVLLKTVWFSNARVRALRGGRPTFVRGGTNEQIDEELARANRVIEPIIGRMVEGLTAPYNYYRGLGDRPDLLDICAKNGLRFMRTWGRDEFDAGPVPHQEPFFYAEQGHPEILECFIHGYLDDYYYGAFCEHPHPQGFAGHLVGLVNEIAGKNLTWSACSHDHVKTEADLNSKLAWLEPFLEAAAMAGMEGLDGRRYYHRRLGALKAAPVLARAT